MKAFTKASSKVSFNLGLAATVLLQPLPLTPIVPTALALDALGELAQFRRAQGLTELAGGWMTGAV